MNSTLRGELWEIEGLLYLILSYQTQNYWLGWVVTAYGIFCIVCGLIYQYLEKLKELRK